MRKSNRRGFTLIEMMIVVLVIAILALIVGLAVRNAGFRAKTARFAADVASLENAAIMYRNDVGSFPGALSDVLSTTVGTPAGYQGPYLSRASIPNCPFCGTPYVYTTDDGRVTCTGTHPTS